MYAIGAQWQMTWQPFSISIHFLLEIILLLFLVPHDVQVGFENQLRNHSTRTNQTLLALYQLSVFQPGGGNPMGSFAFFLGVARASVKSIHNFFYILYFVYGTTFCCSQNDRITWQK